MMMVKFHEFGIAEEIQDLINQSGLDPYAWYVGITKDDNQRNANGRGVNIDDEENYICRNAEARESACRIEKHFIEEIGTDGGTPCNGGDRETTFVYAINKTVYPITEALLLEMNHNI